MTIRRRPSAASRASATGVPATTMWIFVAALLDELEASLCVDLDRVFATGISNGGMFVHRLGCDLPDRFAAIAPVAGTIAKGFNCAPGSSPKISMINIYATQDTIGTVRRLAGERRFHVHPDLAGPGCVGCCGIAGVQRRVQPLPDVEGWCPGPRVHPTCELRYRGRGGGLRLEWRS